MYNDTRAGHVISQHRLAVRVTVPPQPAKTMAWSPGSLRKVKRQLFRGDMFDDQSQHLTRLVQLSIERRP